MTRLRLPQNNLAKAVIYSAVILLADAVILALASTM
jgi:hypothetical protein